MPKPKAGKERKKSAGKNPKQQITELTEQNEQLTQELNALREAHAQLQVRTNALVSGVIDGINKKEFDITETTDISGLSTEVLLAMVSSMVVKKRVDEVSVEARVTELEERVTDMSVDVARLTKMNLAYEGGLESIAASVNFDEMKDKVCLLQLLARQEFHSVTAGERVVIEEAGDERRGEVDTTPLRTVQNGLKLNLLRPNRRLPGETHTRRMNKDLRLFLVQEMSLPKVAGADWQVFARRVGLDADFIHDLDQRSLQCPMERVLAAWGQSETATVRMLHRHLMSPEMRCTILGKRLAEFYDVD